MPALPARAAAYTRTGILKRFLELLAQADPGRVDNVFAEGRMGLKGGDVRAFLQSLRVLGLVDPYGQTTDRARRMRAQGSRPSLVREALREAYPELVIEWDIRGGMPRSEVEDFFKVQYGLSQSSAGPAAKLFCDLMREFARGPEPARPPTRQAEPPAPEPVERWRSPAADPAPAEGLATFTPSAPGDVRLAALDAIKSSLHIEITAEMDEHKIGLLFDRMERLVERILARA